MLFLSLVVTGSILYVPTFAVAVGHRAIVENVHVITGLALLVPLALGVIGPWRARLVRDLRSFDRWTRADFDWFKRRHKRTGAPRGKFNGGQKAEAALLGGGMTVMLVTGVVMRWSPAVFPVNWATGATFVHDVFYLVLFVAIVAHIGFALNRPDQMRSMLTGRIPRTWASGHAPRWLEELEGEQPEELEGEDPLVTELDGEGLRAEKIRTGEPRPSLDRPTLDRPTLDRPTLDESVR